MENNPIIAYCRENPDAEIQDLFKYLYQSCFGCEHLVTDYETALARIIDEAEYADIDNLPLVEMLDGEYCRVHLKMINEGLSPETLCRLFLLSSDKQINGAERLKQGLEKLLISAADSQIPFTYDDVSEAICLWQNKGFDPIHHSEHFRSIYHSAYRVIRKEYLRILPLLSSVDSLLKSESAKNLTVAIDGRCASGKTTLSSLLERIYDCNVFHMDDFFLRPEQRSEQRLNTPGENVDHERFLEEVLIPLNEEREVSYRKYDCHNLRICEAVSMKPKRLNIIEGVYSLHSSLSDYYNLKVFSDIDSGTQRARILKRNTPEMAEKFFSVWIPLEEEYFDKLLIRQKADIII